MDCSQVKARLTVAELMTCFPETIPVFIRHRMACVGCPMAPFETLEGAARVYGLELPPFLQELQEIIERERA